MTECDLLVGLRWWVKDLAGIGGWVEEKERESCGRQLPPGNCLPRVCGGNKGLERWLRVMLMRRRRKKTLNLDGDVALSPLLVYDNFSSHVAGPTRQCL